VSYKYPWLFYIENDNDNDFDSVTVTFQSQYSVVSKKIRKYYENQRLGTTKEGYPFLLFYKPNFGKGNCKIVLFDSLLNVTRSFYINKTELPYVHHPYTYEDITYLSIKKDSIVLKSSLNYNIAYYFNPKEKIVKELRVRGAVYDLSLDKLVKYPISISIKESIVDSHEGKIYKYDLSRNIVYGKISNELLNRETIFIKGGFATQIGKGDIVFYKFCD